MLMTASSFVGLKASQKASQEISHVGKVKHFVPAHVQTDTFMKQ